MRTIQKYTLRFVLLLSPIFFTGFVPQINYTTRQIITSTNWESVGLACLDSVIHGSNTGIQYQFLTTGQLIITDQSNNVTTGQWILDETALTITFIDNSDMVLSQEGIADNTNNTLTCPISQVTFSTFNFRLPMVDATIPDSIEAKLGGYDFEMRLVPSH